jgi:hypothetical protein
MHIGEGELRALGSFGDLFKSVGNCNGNNGIGLFFCVQFKLDFRFCASKKGWESTLI